MCNSMFVLLHSMLYSSWTASTQLSFAAGVHRLV